MGPIWGQNGAIMAPRLKPMPDPKKLNLRLPADLYASAARIAAEQGISLNAFLTLGIRNWVTYQSRNDKAKPPVPPPARTPLPQQVALAKVGRNDPCPCGSGRKFKVCHGKP